MISAADILCMEFLKKSEFTGSHQGMRYRMERSGDELLCTIWPEPFNFHTTPEEEKESKLFTFDEDGVEDAVAWMNDRQFAEPQKWDHAFERWDKYQLVE